MTATDQKYLSAIQTGDPEGLRAIYREFLPRIARLITSNGGSQDDARDVFQDALMIIYEKSRQEDGFRLTSGFYTLLYGISRNLWGNRLQKKSRTEVALPEEGHFTIDADTERLIHEEEENRLFWDAFRKLGEDCQKLLRFFFERKTMEEIMDLMGFGSVSYAKKRKFQCKERLVETVRADARFGELNSG